MSNFQGFKALPKEMKRRVMVRYTLLQIPDLAIFLLVLLLLDSWMDISYRWRWILIGLWIIKDVVLFPLVWRAFQPPAEESGRSLIGMEGTVEKELTPSGFVRVHGELWRAEVTPEDVKVKKGEKVVVQHAHGLTLVVRPLAQ